MIVVDCAAVVDALTMAPDTDRLRARMRSEELHAPMLLDVEVVSALCGLTFREELSAARARDALTDYAALAVQRWESADALRRRAFDLRHNISSYDAAYLVLAESLQCSLLTRDRRLARSSGHDVQIDVQ